MVARVDLTHAELGKVLAREIFKAPGGSGQVSRIQFKGGNYPEESDLGGFCEGALADHIAETLNNLATGKLPTGGKGE